MLSTISICNNFLKWFYLDWPYIFPPSPSSMHSQSKEKLKTHCNPFWHWPATKEREKAGASEEANLI